MKTTILIFTSCFVTSAKAFWSFDNSCACSSQTEPAPPPPPPPCSCSYSAPSYYPPPPPPPPPVYYAPPPVYLPPPPPPPPPEYYLPPPPPPVFYLPPPPIPYPTFQQTSQSYQYSSGAEQQGTAEQISTKTVAIDKTDIFANDDDEAVSNYISIISFYTSQSESAKPNLSCILFDDLGCSITCNEVSRLYDCKSTGACGENNSCSCTINAITSPQMRLADYQNLTLDELWDLTFVKSKLSSGVLKRIKKYQKLSAKLLRVLRKPLRTGDDVKNRLMSMYPEWDKLRDLKSKKKKKINRFITDTYELNESGLEKYVEKSLRRLKTKLHFDYDQATYAEKLTTILDSMNVDDLTYVLRQVREIKLDFSTDFMERYLQDNELEIDLEDSTSSGNHIVDMDRIDNIVAATVNREFIRIIQANLQVNEADENCDCASSEDLEFLEDINELGESKDVGNTEVVVEQLVLEQEGGDKMKEESSKKSITKVEAIEETSSTSTYNRKYKSGVSLSSSKSSSNTNTNNDNSKNNI